MVKLSTDDSHPGTEARTMSIRSSRTCPAFAIVAIGEQQYSLFDPQGQPIGENLRAVASAILTWNQTAAMKIFDKILNAMTFSNAVRIFRNIYSTIKETWMEVPLFARVRELGFVFATSMYDRKRGEMLTRIPAEQPGTYIIYVSPRGRRHEIKDNETVIVPARPNGRRLRYDEHLGGNAYVQVLYPARPWRRSTV